MNSTPKVTMLNASYIDLAYVETTYHTIIVVGIRSIVIGIRGKCSLQLYLNNYNFNNSRYHLTFVFWYLKCGS